LYVSDRWNIAQINVAKFREARERPINADFEAALDEVNALAEAAPGFVWRMIGEGDSEDPALTINITVWQSIDQLAKLAGGAGEAGLDRPARADARCLRFQVGVPAAAMSR
jgi:hypothetical protein